MEGQNNQKHRALISDVDIVILREVKEVIWDAADAHEKIFNAVDLVCDLFDSGV